MATRQFDFIVGPETSVLPTIGTPSLPDDLISLGFADLRYTQGSSAVADVTALKAMAAAERIDGDFVLVKSTNNLYRFNSASSDTGDDNFVLTPSAGTGRWLRVTILNRANTFTDTTQSTTKDTGGAIFEGGVGIEKNLNVGGNLTVAGTTTTVNSTVLDVVDPNITLNKGGSTATANASVAGITVENDGTAARLGYDSSLASRFKAGDSGSESEVMTVGSAQTVSGAKTFTADLIVNNDKAVFFRELTANGTNYIGLKAPASVASDLTFDLPGVDGTSGDLLQTNAAGVMSFTSDLVAKNVTNFLQFDTQGSIPGTPATDKARIYCKTSDNKFYSKDETGVERQLGGGGSGEKNYIADQDVIGSGWLASGAGITVATSSTGSELPEESKATGIKITGVSGTDYARYRFTLDDSDKSKKMKIQFALKTAAGYTASDFKVELYTNTASNYGGTYVALSMSTQNISKADSGIVFLTAVDSNTLDYLELRITRVAGTSSIVISGVIVGPGTPVQSAVVGEWTTFTPTGGFTNTTYSGRYKRVGDLVFLNYRGICTGTPVGTLTLNLPTGMTLDTSKLPVASSNNTSFPGSSVTIEDSTTATFQGMVGYNSSTTNVGLRIWRSDATYATASSGVNATFPMTWTTNDEFFVSFHIPILEFAGGSVDATQNTQNFLINSSVTTSGSDTSSFSYGQVGQAIAAYSSANAVVTKRVRALFNFLASDEIALKISQDGVQWFDAESLFPYLQTTTAKYGARLVRVSGSATDVDVEFGGDGANGQEAWSVYASWKWRVDHKSGTPLVGFSTATSSTSGLISKYNEVTTLTPVVTPTTSGSYTHSLQRAEMIQIGKMVMLSIEVAISASSSPVGNVSIVVAGAPRPDMTNVAMYTANTIYDGISITNENLEAGLDDTGSQATFFLYKCGFAGGTATKIVVGEINNAAFKVRLNLTYKAQL